MLISHKLIIGFVASITLPILIISLLLISKIQQQTLQSTQTSIEREVSQIDNAIHLFFLEIEKNVKYLSRHKKVIAGKSKLATYTSNNDSVLMTPLQNSSVEKELYQLFTDFGDSHDGIAYIYLGNEQAGYLQWPNGKIGKSYDPRIRPWYQTGITENGEIKRTQAYYFASDDAVIISTVKAFQDSQGTNLGVIGMDVSLGGLSEIVKKIKLGESGYLMLIEDSGTILVDPKNAENNFVSFTEAQQGLFKPLADISSGQVELDINGESYFANVYTSSHLGWKFVGLLKASEVLASANEMTSRIIFLSIILVLLFSSGAVYLSRLISTPIVKVTNGLERISKGDGDLTQRLNINAKDETGKLADN
ncbi:MAG: cache domain-containing protein, partial [Kangiellaceae bacterium]